MSLYIAFINKFNIIRIVRRAYNYFGKIIIEYGSIHLINGTS